MTVDTHARSVFDLALPRIAYHDAADPDQAHTSSSRPGKTRPSH
jgi:hypothetical protein